MKILVVDDHALIRDGLRHVLRSLDADALCLEAGSACEARDVVNTHPDLDLVLLDLKLPGVDGHTLMRELHERNGSLPIAIVSSNDDMASISRALHHGAVGFVPKSSQRRVMLHALRLILSGGVYVPPQALGLAADSSGVARSHRDSVSNSRPSFTDRQAQVLALIAQGRPNKVIAQQLNISEATVKAHVTDIMRALGVTNRAQAAIAAKELGFC